MHTIQVLKPVLSPEVVLCIPALPEVSMSQSLVRLPLAAQAEACTFSHLQASCLVHGYCNHTGHSMHQK